MSYFFEWLKRFSNSGNGNKVITWLKDFLKGKTLYNFYIFELFINRIKNIN
jgi:hypothetical protein